MPSLSRLLPSVRSFSSKFRLYNTRSCILFYLLGRSVTGTLLFDLTLVGYIGVFMLTYAASSVINHHFDIQVDRLNRRLNPYIHTPSYLHSTYLRLVVLSLIFSSIFSLIADIRILFTCVFILILGFVYSHPRIHLSHHPLGKLLSMLVIYTAAPLFAGLSFSLDSRTLPVFMSSLLLSASWLLYSDIKDITGDLKVGKRTVANTLGLNRVLWLSVFLSLPAVLYFIRLPLQNSFSPRFSMFLLGILWLIQFWVALHPNIVLRDRPGQRWVGFFVLMALVFLIFDIR